MGREFVAYFGSLLWLVAIGFGFWSWDRYAATPGAIGAPITEAPVGPGTWELTLYAHPHCPCVRAAFDALGELARESPELRIRVAFVRPPGAVAGWERSEAWARAERVPGARPFCDAGGGLAKRAGAETSGTAVLVGPNGRVAFRGGLTPARGHGADGPGLRAVRTWLKGEAGSASASVFGCPLFDGSE